MITDFIGWIGAALLIAAYFLVSTKKITPTSVTYQLMNFLGAFGAGINVFAQSAYPSVALETVWGSIAIYGLYKALRK
ncbi:hypothetical protein A3J13_02205 [Candidatus Daviesbacteria bacterium RIFCSPLOWO2_02_FULL_36_8]|uniref:CBU-0592-like domain-containing protein n=1 Tax=Candidatus Daviesbacteria bacterium RIFCSPLOWO2_02_FULL_36_8 TaxID=1797793 RepID=A0A1F5MH33_9BACT|nr:MAG: hypothetical protein A3J13_02205 [Candidatus Daviesbacteria bacterium RIFCSPLOWO2_02_FULL_36_8]